MSSTQLTCPHCGSTLNFGVAVEPGAVVECLICMRTFSAASTECPAATETQELRAPLRPADTMIVERSELPRPPISITDQAPLEEETEDLPKRPVLRPRRAKSATAVGGTIALGAVGLL